MTTDIYLSRRIGTITLVIAAALVVGAFILFSNRLVDDLSAQERQRMELWADATRRLAAETPSGDSDVGFMLSVIESNRTIPVILADSGGSVLLHRNFTSIPQDTAAFLARRLGELGRSGNVIEIPLSGGNVQKLYYADSTLLRRLSLYPYVQTAVMAAFIAVVYFAVTATRKAEQNKVWVGLSKETAHQLGTPISSLMAWIQVLRAGGADRDILEEMDKDVGRLASVAARFGKVGSPPVLEPGDAGALAAGSVAYMQRRVGTAVTITAACSGSCIVSMSAPLLEWVMENLIKNAVDAMEGRGRVEVTVAPASPSVVAVEVSDTGKGISRNRFKTIFRPGFTTRKRGWGLGLTLAKRIVEDYHGGSIFVRSSVPGRGTVMRIELPARQIHHAQK